MLTGTVIMNKKVLLVTTYFAPDNSIAAVRTTKVAKYLRLNGYDVDVIAVNNNTENDEVLLNDAEEISVRRVSNSDSYKRFEKGVHRLFGRSRERKLSDVSNRRRLNPKTGRVEFYPFEVAHPFFGSVYYLLSLLKERDYYKCIKKDIRDLNQYDYLLTSYGDMFCYYFGMEYHRLFPKVKWVMEFRDPMYRYKFIPEQVKGIPLSLEKKAWKYSDAIILISKGMCSSVPEKYQDKVYLITNGYDTDDCFGYCDNLEDGKLTIAFTGSMYGGMMDLSVVFKAIRELLDSEAMDNSVEIHFAGSKSAAEAFCSQAGKYNLNHLIVNHGRVTRLNAMQLQEQSDILLCPSYGFEADNKGVITGKIFEYMRAKRSVVAVITGDVQHSELGEIVRKTNIGCVYEEAHDDRDYAELLNYLKNQYFAKKEYGRVKYEPNAEAVNQFDYKNLIKKYLDVLD